MSGRRGFTIVELMLATTIMVMVVGGTLSAFLGVQRMTRAAIAETELSVGMRELREKLLFHVAPPHGGRVWSGILSGIGSGGVIEGDQKILMDVSCGYDMTSGKVVDQRIELLPEETESVAGVRRFFKNDGDRYDEHWDTRWLDPGSLSWLPEAEFLDSTTLAEGAVFYVTLQASVNDVTRRERIAVPVFGFAQRTVSGKVFDD